MISFPAEYTMEKEMEKDIFLKAVNPLKQDVTVALTASIPCSEGLLKSADSLTLYDENTVIPCQKRVLARWNDRSIKVVFIDFVATLHTGTNIYRIDFKGDRKTEYITQQSVKIRPCEEGENQVIVDDRFYLKLVLVDSRNQKYRAKIKKVKKQNGRLTKVTTIYGSFVTKTNVRGIDFTLTLTGWAGCRLIKIEPEILVNPTEGVFFRVRELKLSLTPISGGITDVFFPDVQTNQTQKVKMFQIDDEHCTIQLDKNTETRNIVSTGTFMLNTDDQVIAGALKDFAVRWPKSMEYDGYSINIGLFPSFKRGTFNHMQPWYKYGYLFHGSTYLLKTGQKRRWEIWLDMNGNWQLCKSICEMPAVAVVDPEYAISTGVYGNICAAGKNTVDYDRVVSNMFDLYFSDIRKNRDTGEMNWGDWFGERFVNWGNNEYDTAEQLFIQFIRTGDLRYFVSGENAARHTDEVDIIHSVNRDLIESFNEEVFKPFDVMPGCVHEHTIGHVGGFCSRKKVKKMLSKVLGVKNPYLCLDPWNMGHLWLEGLRDAYFFTGDEKFKQTVILVADYLSKVVAERLYPFSGHAHSGRTVGWPLTALCAAYDIKKDRKYLKAMKILVNDMLAEQDPHCGGWLYELPDGHCNCVRKKHVGSAGFLISILVNGLSRYYEMTGDKRIPQAVKKAMEFLVVDTWDERTGKWRYTSCPVSPFVEPYGLILLSLANGINIGNVDVRDVFVKNWQHFVEGCDKDINQKMIGRLFSIRLFGTAKALKIYHQIKSNE